MAFGSGQGAASPAGGFQGRVVQPGLGWADSSNRVVTVLVLGVPLLLIVLVSTTTGYTFFTTALTGSGTTVPSWANVPLRGLGIAADVGFLFLLVLLAAFSEGAGALAVAILAAIWFAYLLGHGSAILQRVATPATLGDQAGQQAGTVAFGGTNATKGA